MGLFLNMGRTASQWGPGENTSALRPFTKSTLHLKDFSGSQAKPGNALNPVTWNDITQTKKKKKKNNEKIQAHEVLQDTELWTQVVVKLLACQKIKLLLRCPLEFPVLVINSGFNNRIPLVLLRFIIVALQTLRWASLNAALHSFPVIVTPCTEKVKGLWGWFTHGANIQWTV